MSHIFTYHYITNHNKVWLKQTTVILHPTVQVYFPLLRGTWVHVELYQYLILCIRI